MTVKELMGVLSRYPPQTRVVVRGYESGYNDITEIKETEIAPDVHGEWYYGAHDDRKSDTGQGLSPEQCRTPALVLAGKNTNAKEV